MTPYWEDPARGLTISVNPLTFVDLANLALGTLANLGAYREPGDCRHDP